MIVWHLQVYNHHYYGGFLKWGYPQIIHFNVIFHEINHPAIGVPPFVETLIVIWNQ